MAKPSRSFSSHAKLLRCVVTLALLAYGSCAKPKRFANLQSLPAPIPDSFADSTGPVSERLKAVIASLANLPVGEGTLPLFERRAPNEQNALFSANVSVVEASTQPLSLYFTSGAQAQAEMVKMYAGLLAKESNPKTALKELFDVLQDSNAKVTPNPNRFRAEFTISHGLDSAADWDRISLFLLVLAPLDPEIRVIDTNQLESIIKDLEIGTLTQTTSFEASIGGKRSSSSTLKPDELLTLGSASELAPSAKASYSEQLQRKLREQLNLRSSSIDSQGKVFRLVYKTNGIEQIPSMTRQVLTFEYDPMRRRRTVTVVDFSTDVKGEVTKLASSATTQFEFQRADSNNLAMNYEVMAKPLAIGVVRRIRNLKGIRTLGFEDDDKVALVPAIVDLPAVKIGEVPVRHYALSLGSSSRYISIQEGANGSPDVACFRTMQAAQKFREWLLRVSNASPNSQGSGAFLTDKQVESFGDLRVGLPSGLGDGRFRSLRKDELSDIKVSVYSRQ